MFDAKMNLYFVLKFEEITFFPVSTTFCIFYWMRSELFSMKVMLKKI